MYLLIKNRIKIILDEVHDKFTASCATVTNRVGKYKLVRICTVNTPRRFVTIHRAWIYQYTEKTKAQSK